MNANHLQLLGASIIVAALFLASLVAGLVAFGLALLLLGIAMERS